MKKSEKKAWLEQMAAELKKQQEEERLAFLAAAKERRAAHRKATQELAKKDDEEQAIRDVVLKRIVEMFQVSTMKKLEYERALRQEEEWKVYLAADGSPDPRSPPQLTCALHRWRTERADNHTDDSEFISAQMRNGQLQPILKVLDEVIKYPDDISLRKLRVFKEVREEMCTESTFVLSRGTRQWAWAAPSLGEVRHNHGGIPATPHVLTLWARIPPPRSMPRPHDPPSPAIEVDFPEMGLQVTLPGARSWRGAVLRAIWCVDDRLSGISSEQVDPLTPEPVRGKDLYSLTRHEYEEVCRLRKEQAETRKGFYDDIKARTEVLQNIINEDKFAVSKAEKLEVDRLAGTEPAFVMLPRDILIKEEEDEDALFLQGISKKERQPGVISLRSHRPCGGVLSIELMHLPPRPKRMRGDLTITLLEEGDGLREMEYSETYTPPPPPAPGAVRAPEEIEADIRKQEAALERLMLVNIQLPDTVLWLEPPIVCCWNEEIASWTTAGVYDPKYNEDKFTINFRTGKLRPIGFATAKYSNLPYQGWELKPNDDNTGVNITIMGAVVVCEFFVSDNFIIVKSIQNGATSALQDMVECRFTIRELIARLQAGGVDFFPAEDASTLMEGTCRKLRVLEDHLYHCMAHLCIAHNFTWSRWNVNAGKRAIVQQMREYVHKKRETLQILHVTPLEAILVKATEVSAEYTTQPIDGLQFYPDLYSLMEGHGSEEAKQLVSNVSWKMVEAVKDLLCAVRPCSYS